MNKLRSILLIILSVFLIIVPQLSAQNREFVLYTWEDMFPEEILRGFERDTGIRIRYETFETNEEMLDKLLENNGGGFDLIIADDYIVEFVNHPEWKLAQILDKRQIPNFGNIDPFFQRQLYDPDDEYTVPYGAGVTTIVYDPRRVNIPISGLTDLWHPSLRNNIGIIGNYRVINGMALKVHGRSYNTTNIADIRAAGNLLMQLSPNIRIIKDIGLEEDLVSGNVSVAVMYTDQVMKSRLARPELRTVFPSEGIGFGIMPAFIPVRASNPVAAHRFLNYILDPVQGARSFEHLGYYCTFQASRPHINPALREFLIMPDFLTFEAIHNISQDAEDEHWSIWEQFTASLERRPTAPTAVPTAPVAPLPVLPMPGPAPLMREEARRELAQNEISRVNTSLPLYHLLVLDRSRSARNSDISDMDNASVLYKYRHGTNGYLVVLYRSPMTGPVFPQFPDGSRIVVNMSTVVPQTLRDYIGSSAFRRFVSNRTVLAQMRDAL